MKLNNKGYLIIEVILSTVIALGMAYFLLDITIGMKNKNQDVMMKTNLLKEKTIIENVVNSRIKLLSDSHNLFIQSRANRSTNSGFGEINSQDNITQSSNPLASPLVDTLCPTENAALVVMMEYSSIRVESYDSNIVACIRFFRDSTDRQYYFEYFEGRYQVNSEGHLLGFKAGNGTDAKYAIRTGNNEYSLKSYSEYVNPTSTGTIANKSFLKPKNKLNRFIARNQNDSSIDDELNDIVSSSIQNDISLANSLDWYNQDYYYPMYVTDDEGNITYDYYYKRPFTFTNRSFDTVMSGQGGTRTLTIKSDYLDELFSINFYLDLDVLE